MTNLLRWRLPELVHEFLYRDVKEYRGALGLAIAFDDRLGLLPDDAIIELTQELERQKQSLNNALSESDMDAELIADLMAMCLERQLERRHILLPSRTKTT